MEIVTVGDEVTVLTVVVRTVITVFVVVDCLRVVVTTARVVLPLLTVTTGGVNVEVEVATARIHVNFWLFQDSKKAKLTSRSDGGGDIGRNGGRGNVEGLAERSVNKSRSSGNTKTKLTVLVSVKVVVATSGARLCSLFAASLLALRSAILASRSRGTERSNRPRRILTAAEAEEVAAAVDEAESSVDRAAAVINVGVIVQVGSGYF